MGEEGGKEKYKTGDKKQTNKKNPRESPKSLRVPGLHGGALDHQARNLEENCKMPVKLNYVNNRGNQQQYALDGTPYIFSKWHVYTNHAKATMTGPKSRNHF